MDTEMFVYVTVLGVVLFSVNMMVLYVCTKILQSLSQVLKECAKVDIKKYLDEEKQSPVPQKNPGNDLYRNKDGKLSYLVYNDNKNIREAASSSKIDFGKEFDGFEHKPTDSGKG